MTQTKRLKAEQPLCSPQQLMIQRQNLSPAFVEPLFLPTHGLFFSFFFFKVPCSERCSLQTRCAIWKLMHGEVERAVCSLCGAASKQWRTESQGPKRVKIKQSPSWESPSVSSLQTYFSFEDKHSLSPAYLCFFHQTCGQLMHAPQSKIHMLHYPGFIF